jgi:CRISPR system Cascade subunit CasB
MPTADDDWHFYWRRHTDGAGHWASRTGRREPEGPPGADLAALRRGLGRSPGSVPEMWRFYKNSAEGKPTAFEAEHAALTLFAIHQQSQDRPMHRDGIGLGTAVLALRQHGQPKSDQPKPEAADAGKPESIDWSKIDPVDRRFHAAATASDLTELIWHLRGLITQLRGIDQPLDYTRLYKDLCTWQWPDGADEVRRCWGMQYFTRVKDTLTDPAESDPGTTKLVEETK